METNELIAPYNICKYNNFEDLKGINSDCDYYDNINELDPTISIAGKHYKVYYSCPRAEYPLQKV